MKRIAYLILAHSDPLQFSKLINALGKKSDIYVHVDYKVNASHFMCGEYSDNVYFIKDRISVSWAGISMIEAQLNLLRAAVNNHTKYSHVVFLSGSCYPIKNVDYISDFFFNSPQKEFIKFIDMRNSPNLYLRQISNRWFKEPFIRNNNNLIVLVDKIVRRLLNKIRMKNTWPEHIVPYFGSQWCALTIKCCKYILEYNKENPWFKDINRYTFSPDEHYFHTIIGNSPFAKYSDGIQPFRGVGTWRMANFHMIDKSLAKWYTIHDWDEIISSDKLFVRKIRSVDGAALVDEINKSLYYA